ncbi:MAG: hypothetical protein LC800_07425 [Acidobacteria bacterium]|nr:hypothetical protein [Acidobacteriota bacterium]
MLRVDVEPEVIAQLRAQFPAPAVREGEQHLARDAEQRLAQSVMAGLKFGKAEVLGMIKQWEEMRARAPDTFDLRRHLSAFREDLERRDARR